MLFRSLGGNFNVCIPLFINSRRGAEGDLEVGDLQNKRHYRILARSDAREMDTQEVLEVCVNKYEKGVI